MKYGQHLALEFGIAGGNSSAIFLNFNKGIMKDKILFDNLGKVFIGVMKTQSQLRNAGKGLHRCNEDPKLVENCRKRSSSEL